MPGFVLTNQIALRLDQSSLSSVTKQLDKSLAPYRNLKISVNLVGIGGNAVQFFNQLSQSARTAESALKGLAHTANSLGNINQQLTRSTHTSAASFTDFARSVLAGAVAYRFAVSQMREVMALEKGLAGTAQITGGNSLASSSSIKKRVLDSSSQFGANPQKILGATNQLLQAGLQSNEVDTNMIAKLSLNSQVEDLNQVIKLQLLLRNVYKESTPEIEKHFGMVIDLAKKSSTSVEGLSKAVQLSGGAWQQAGGNVEDLMATVAMLSDKTQRSAEEIGHAMKFITSRLTGSPQIIRQLEGYNIKLFDKGKYVGIAEAFERISKAYASMPQGSRGQLELLQVVGGARQSNITANILTGLADAHRLKAESQKAGNALDRDSAIAQETLSNKLEKVKVNLLKLADSLYEKRIRGWADALLNASDSLSKMGDTLSHLLPMILALAGSTAVGSIGSAFGKMSLAGKITTGGVLAGAAGTAVAGYAGYGKTAATIGGGTTGFIVGSLINPWVGAMTAVIGGLKGFGDAIEEDRKALLNSAYEKSSKKAELLEKSGGFANKAQLAEFASEVAGLQKEEKEKFKNISGQSMYWGSVGSSRSPSETKGLIIDQRTSEVQKKATDFLERNGFRLRDRWLSESKTLQDFQKKQKESGIDLSIVARQAGLHTWDKDIEDKFKQRKSNGKGLPGSNNPLDIESSHAVEVARQNMQEQMASYAHKAGQSEIANLSQIRSWSGYTGGLGVSSDALVKQYAKNLTGTDDIGELSKRYSNAMRQMQEELQNGNSDLKSLQDSISPVIKAMTALGDASQRTATDMEDLSMVERGLSGKYSASEQIAGMSRRQRRELNQGRSALENALNNENGLSGLSERDRQKAMAALRVFGGVNGLGSKNPEYADLTGEEAKRKLLEKSFPEMFQGDIQKRDELRQKIIEKNSQAVDAQKALANGVPVGTETFVGATNNFGSHVAAFDNAVKNLPQSVEFRGAMQVQVNHVGADALAAMEPAIVERVMQEVNKQFRLQNAPQNQTEPPSMRGMS